MAIARSPRLMCFNAAFGRQYKTIVVLCLILVVYLLAGNINLTKRVSATVPSNDVSTIRQVHECNCILTIAGSVPNNTQVVARQWKGDNKQSIADLHAAMLNETDMKQQIHELHQTQSAADVQPNNDTLNASVDWSAITLKPNFSSIINASQSRPTLTAPYLLENPTLCSSVKNLSIAIIIHTSTDHVERRSSIRNTWANGTYYQHLGNVRVIFLLGTTMDGAIQQAIEKEFKTYGDVLQGDFKDDYHNLTLKGIMAYKWLTERCRNANIILKVDDDISVDMFKLFTEHFPIYRLKTNTIICNHIIPHTMGIIREKESKWYVKNHHFRGLGAYPTGYCSGFFVIFTNDIIPSLYKSSMVTPFFWVDDVYLYGLVPGNVPRVTYVGLTGNWHQLGGQDALRCYRNETTTCPFIAVGAGAKGDMEDIWPQMVKQYALSVK